MTQHLLWTAPPTALTLSNEDVHVWRASLDRSTTQIRHLKQVLSLDERTRADSFYFTRDQERFVTGRGLLRIILSRYAGLPPQHLRFCYGTRGKPELESTASSDVLSFNISHSQGTGLYALTRRRAIGVDIEHVRLLSKAEQMAERFFSPIEHTALQALAPEDYMTGFFNCWTRKEAYVKARGDGLAHPLDRFAVSVAPNEPAALLQTMDDPGEVARWSLQELCLGPSFVAALAVEGHDWRLTCWHYPDEYLP
jgi:4'-phosphopantetheinyl transferase